MPMTMDERLEHARAAIAAYFAAKGEAERTCDAEYEDTDVSDIIADLLHLQTFSDSGISTERSLQPGCIMTPNRKK